MTWLRKPACAFFATMAAAGLFGCVSPAPYVPDLSRGPTADLRMQSYITSATAMAVPGACASTPPQRIALLEQTDKSPHAPEPFVDIKIPAGAPVGIGFENKTNLRGDLICAIYGQFTPEAGKSYLVNVTIGSRRPKPMCEMIVYEARLNERGLYWNEPIPVAPLSRNCN